MKINFINTNFANKQMLCDKKNQIQNNNIAFGNNHNLSMREIRLKEVQAGKELAKKMLESQTPTMEIVKGILGCFQNQHRTPDIARRFDNIRDGLIADTRIPQVEGKKDLVSTMKFLSNLLNSQVNEAVRSPDSFFIEK